ncbi:MAG TPA: DUF47 family protein [Gemmatimonadaceae bacterium]|nr:DUF47 family protein [Gemmatimonadaceae bacterium]
MRLIPRDTVFYTMFADLAERLVRASRLLRELLAEPARLDRLITGIKQVEHEADEITRDIINRIDKTFVTPIDREDIHLLASALDNVIDLVDGTARRAAMFHLTEVREPARRLADVLVRSADTLAESVAHMKEPKFVAERSRTVKQLEEEGDALYHEAVGALFAGTPDPLEVIKWKEMYDVLERALDECEDVANVLESIALKHA